MRFLLSKCEKIGGVFDPLPLTCSMGLEYGYLHERLKFMGFHVGKYTNPMEHIGSTEEISYGFNH